MTTSTGDGSTDGHGTKPTRLLIVEWQAGGHRAFHIDHLISYLLAERPNLEVVFALSSELVAQLPSGLREALEDPAVPQCRLRILPSGAPPRLRAMSPLFRGCYDLFRGLHDWHYVRRLARRLDVSHVHFHYFDHAFLGAVLPLQGRGHCTFSGLLFRISIHYAGLDGAAEPTVERRRNWLKSRLYRRLFSNPRLTAAFCFDRYFGQFSGRHFAEGRKVVFVPDPVTVEIEKLAARERSPSAGGVSFLLFGALTKRKGVLVVLEALAQLSDDVAARCHLRFAGKVDPAIRRAFYARLERVRSAGIAAKIDVVDRYLEDDEIAAMVRDSDVILVPYLRHVGSSGLLYWAAAARKPIITQDCGLVGREARDFGLGLAVDTLSPAVLAEAMATAIRACGRGLASADGQARFIEGHHGRDFAAALIAGMTGRREPAT